MAKIKKGIESKRSHPPSSSSFSRTSKDKSRKNKKNKQNKSRDKNKNNQKSLAKLNKIVENLTDHSTPLPNSIWDEWLWRTNPQQLPPIPGSLLNKNQLIGLMIARYRAIRQPAPSGMVKLSHTSLRIVDKEIHCMTLRELRDTITNVILLWGKHVFPPPLPCSPTPSLFPSSSSSSSFPSSSSYSREEEFEDGRGGGGGGETEENVRCFLDACFHRFGELCWARWKVGHKESPIADDVASIERVTHSTTTTARRQQQHQHQQQQQQQQRKEEEGGDEEQVTLTCIRNLVNMFLIAYRLLHWHITSNHDHEYQHNDDDGPSSSSFSSVDIQKHHVQASLDVFYKLAMYYDLPPSARLNYMHNFSGLYNCISQVSRLPSFFVPFLPFFLHIHIPLFCCLQDRWHTTTTQTTSARSSCP
jgi:hypothetical protein